MYARKVKLRRSPPVAGPRYGRWRSRRPIGARVNYSRRFGRTLLMPLTKLLNPLSNATR